MTTRRTDGYRFVVEDGPNPNSNLRENFFEAERSSIGYRITAQKAPIYSLGSAPRIFEGRREMEIYVTSKVTYQENLHQPNRLEEQWVFPHPPKQEAAQMQLKVPWNKEFEKLRSSRTTVSDSGREIIHEAISGLEWREDGAYVEGVKVIDIESLIAGAGISVGGNITNLNPPNSPYYMEIGEVTDEPGHYVALGNEATRRNSFYEQQVLQEVQQDLNQGNLSSFRIPMIEENSIEPTMQELLDEMQDLRESGEVADSILLNPNATGIAHPDIINGAVSLQTLMQNEVSIRTLPADPNSVVQRYIDDNT